MDNYLFGKVCELEARLELANNRAWLMQGLVKHEESDQQKRLDEQLARRKRKKQTLKQALEKLNDKKN